MAWRDKLQPASFRGVPFFVDGDDATFGRRTVVHEYPQRDKPWAEDMGRATREYSLQAFVVGPDYMAARDKLLQAIEQPGAGQLVHPFYGQLVVSIKDFRVSHRREDGGMAAFQITFVEAGELAFPQAKDRARSLVGRAADSLQAGSLADFTSKFTVDGFPQFLSDAAIATATDVVGTATKALRYVQNPGALLDLVVDVTGVADPGSLGSRLQGLFASGTALYRAASSMFPSGQAAYYGDHARGALDLYYLLPHSTATGRTASRRQQIVNANALNGIVRRQCLVQAAGAASLMPALVYDDVADIRQRLAAAIDAELMQAPDALLGSLQDMRAASHKDLTERARGSARLRVVTPQLPVTAAALAYDLYEDAARGDEIVQRNRVPHPAFISTAVQVLSR